MVKTTVFVPTDAEWAALQAEGDPRAREDHWVEVEDQVLPHIARRMGVARKDVTYTTITRYARESGRTR